MIYQIHLEPEKKLEQGSEKECTTKRDMKKPSEELAIATGGSVRKLQWKKAREAVIPPKQARASFKQRNISIVSSATTSPISSPAVSPVSTPSNSPQTSPTQPPMISPALSVSSHTPEQLPQTNSLGVHFKVGDNVCIASGGKTYDFATVEKIWTSRVDITYLKKAGPKLSTWKLGSGKLYKDSIHKNSVFHCLGKVDLVEVLKKEKGSGDNQKDADEENGIVCEISPLVSYAGEGLEDLVKGKSFVSPLYLEQGPSDEKPVVRQGERS
ncbi:UAP1 [Mytilus edulis]|uniref:UAP1 n=1 Tax=Mytilus edulis TaxID=6550 RepID=A0A8S3TCT6_MYTED|nr:UAP1 [Mytilus edulis]